MKKHMNYLLTSVVAMALLTLISCKDDDDEKLPTIDGYNNSNEVASDNLVAHWTFDDTQNERLSSTAPQGEYGTVSFTDGRIGNALKLDSGALVYPAISSISTANALNNFTVSMWVDVDNTKGTTNYFSTFFSLAPSNVSDIWPDIFMGAETGRHLPSSDTLELKGLLNTHPEGLPNSLQDNIAQPNPNDNDPDSGTGMWFLKSGDWTHFVLSWNASTHKLNIYANGISVGGFSTRANTGVEVLAVPVQAIFGSFPSSDLGFSAAPATQPWGPLVTASIDDARIYNSALSQAEVTALYNLGVAGR